MALRCKWYNVSLHVSYIVHGLHNFWCLFQGWVVDTLGNTFGGCVTQDTRVGPSEACAVHSRCCCINAVPSKVCGVGFAVKVVEC